MAESHSNPTNPAASSQPNWETDAELLGIERMYEYSERTFEVNRSLQIVSGFSRLLVQPTLFRLSRPGMELNPPRIALG